jgi:hypothetical protein
MKRLLLLALLALTACERDIYTVTMEATDAGFDRRLVVVRRDSGGVERLPPDDVLAQMDAAYAPGERPAPGTFAASFAGATPADIGGRGALARCVTSMGTSFVYLERFRGEMETSAHVDQIQEAASTVASLALGWLDEVLAEEPTYPAFRAELEARLDPDLRNLAMLNWIERNSNRIEEGQDFPHFVRRSGVRLAAYLHERGYVQTSDLPNLMSALSDSDALARGLVGWLARGLGLEAEGLPESLRELATIEALESSWHEYILVSPEALSHLEEWTEKTGITFPSGQDDSDYPERLQIFDHLITIASSARRSDGAEDEILTILACPVKPIATNGEWSSDHREITWSFSVEPTAKTSYLVPAVAFAAWAEPDKQFQVDHFGYLVLIDEPLAAYCAWRARLGPAEGDRWDHALASCTSRGQAISLLESFRPGDDPAWHAEQTGLTLMLDALRPTRDGD